MCHVSILVSDSLNPENAWEMEISVCFSVYCYLDSLKEHIFQDGMCCSTFACTRMRVHTSGNTPPTLMFN